MSEQTHRIRVAVIFGGRSTEHSVSSISAAGVIPNIDPERYEVIPVGITQQGTWVLGPSDMKSLALTGDGELPSVSTELARVDQVETLSDVDVVFPLLHGAFGEDGTIQGLLEMAGVPYVGAGVLASAVSTDKEFTKKLFGADGLPLGSYEVLRPNVRTLSEGQKERLGLPVFVKPARAGSSYGITKVNNWAGLDGAIAFARAVDPKVIVEAMVVGREIECGVLEFPDGHVEASLPSEVRITTDAEYYDFKTKYLDDSLELDIPAKLDDATIEEIRTLSVRAFRAVDGQGLARVDFFVRPDGELVVNELNTMPGFTPSSAYPKMWAVTGIDYPSLVATLIETAIARGTGLR